MNNQEKRKNIKLDPALLEALKVKAKQKGYRNLMDYLRSLVGMK